MINFSQLKVLPLRASIWALTWLAVPSAFSQDISIPTPATKYIKLARGKAFADFAVLPSGVAYIFQSVSPDVNTCVFITNNNPTNTHAVTVTVFTTPDGTINQFTTNPSPWVFARGGDNGLSKTIPAHSTFATGATLGWNLQTGAAAQIAVEVQATSAAGSPDTADITAVQVNAASPCGAGTAISSGTGPFTNPFLRYAVSGANTPTLAANQIFLSVVSMEAKMGPYTSLGWVLGSQTLANDFDMGFYDVTGTLVTHCTGAPIQFAVTCSTGQCQTCSITSTTFNPGTYLMAETGSVGSNNVFYGNLSAGLINYTTVTTSSGGVLPASIVLSSSLTTVGNQAASAWVPTMVLLP
jgi:hypothetical protein